jgi:hypothetical protein
MGNLSFSPTSSPLFEPEPERSHGQQQTERGHSSDSAAAVKVLRKKIVAEVIVDEQEQDESDQDGTDPHQCPSESSDGARLVVLAQSFAVTTH